MLLTAAVWPVQVVEVVLPGNGNKVIAAGRISPGQMIKLSYRHSNELIQVEGRFTVDKQSGIFARETRFESAGSGLPVGFPDRTTKDGDWFVVDEMDRKIDSLRFYMMPINNTRLTIGDDPVRVSDLDAGTLIEVRALRIPRIKWLLKKTDTRS